jgi:UrcA family protein
MKTLALVFSALLFGSLAATAHATTTAAKDVPSEVVSYADLNLANEADAAILLQRVKAAAYRVCSVDVELLPLNFGHPVKRCAADATARAMADVDARTAIVAYVRP